MTSLSFSVKDIPPEGLHVACLVGRDALQLDEQDLVRAEGLALTATIRAEDENFLVEGELNGLLAHECVRCLEEFSTPAVLSFRALYKDLSRRRSPGAVPRNTDQDEMDCHPVVEQQIQLQEMLREQLILSIPMQPLCAESCQGLCWRCGKNLNVETCGCEEIRAESPFAALHEAFKLSPKQSA